MANPSKGAKDTNEKSKEPFVSQADRPEVRLDLDMPINELRVRDLAAILGLLTTKSPFEAGKTSLKDFFDKDFPEVGKDYVKEVKIEKVEKPEKPEKFEKNEKIEKPEKHEKFEKLEKPEKPEKFEKPEIKELKNEKLEKVEKLENDGVGFSPKPDPRMEQVIQTLAGLTRQVGQLADQVEELQKKRG
jgi:hypothetical protein